MHCVIFHFQTKITFKRPRAMETPNRVRVLLCAIVRYLSFLLGQMTVLSSPLLPDASKSYSSSRTGCMKSSRASKNCPPSNIRRGRRFNRKSDNDNVDKYLFHRSW